MTDELNDLEKQYFESRGETPLPEAEPKPETTETAKEEIKDQPKAEEKAESQDAGDKVETSDLVKDEEDKKPQKLVPLAALHEERQNNKQLKVELAELRKRLDQIQAPPAQQQSQPGEPANPNDDPVKFLNQLKSQLEQSQQHQILTHIALSTRMAEEKFTRENPDYEDAIDWLAVRSAEQMKILHPQLDEETISDLVEKQKQNLAIQAMRNGQNPAEIAYGMAKMNGYPGKQAPQPPTQTPQEKVQKNAEAEARARSIGNIGGAAPKAISIEILANMSEAEMAKLSPEEFAKYFGA